MSATISKSSFKFLKDLSENNHRDWFNEHKDRYIQSHEEVIALADELLTRLSETDQISTQSGKKSLMRIYRDVRFSKDKSPYNPRFAGGFGRVKPQLRGGYFFQIKPGNTLIGGGFYGPNPADLKLIRDHLAQDDEPLRSVLEEPAFKKMFGELRGETVKTAPKGFAKDHPAIDLLRFKSMYVFRDFTDEEATGPDFADQALATWQTIRPFFDVMTEILTTDLNGLSLID